MKKDKLLEVFKDTKVKKNQMLKLKGGLALVKTSETHCTQNECGSDDWDCSDVM